MNNNPALARIFDEVADLLDFKGENPFRVNSYRRAARAVRDLREDVAELAERGELRKVDGVGEAIAKKISEFLGTGEVQSHRELLAEFPATLPQLLQVPGLGPKKVGMLFKELGVASLDGLRAAIEDGRVETLAGFGKKTAEKIREGLDFLAESSGRTITVEAWPVATALREMVAALPGVRRVEIAGSLRRGCETCGDIDLLCDADNGPEVVSAFTRLPQAASVRASGDTKGSILVPRSRGGELQVDLRVVPTESFGAALQYFTGSKEHNVRLRELAIRCGWRLNEYGLHEGEKRIAGATEEEIYARLGMPWVPPELREDRGEFEAGADFARLVTRADLLGDLHVHTTASDGACEIEEIALAARERGYSYLGIADHSQSSVIANGLSVERLLEHAEKVRAANRRLEGITLLAGTECDILPDGTLDYPDEVLAQLDWVVASIHNAQQQDRAKLMKRCIVALENPYVCVLGHPSGRVLGRRDAMDLDWDELFKVAARTGTALEINASYKRLDLKDEHVHRAMDAGCWLSINTDAHWIPELDFMPYGVQVARRGWATRDRVLNTMPVEKLRAWVAAKRG